MEFIIGKYVKIIQFYLSHLSKSGIIVNNENTKNIVLIGLNSIIHIFKITLHNTKDIEYTQTSCLKATYCFLEYIERINDLSNTCDLNIINAVAFIYKKTLLPDSSITSSNNQNAYDGIPVLGEVIENISTISNIILFCKNEIIINKTEPLFDIQHIIRITNTHLENFICIIYNNPELLQYLLYIQQIKEKLNIDYDDYNLLLLELYKRLKNTILQNTRIIDENDEYKTLNEKLNEKYIELFLIDENKNKINVFMKEKKMNLLIKFLLDIDK